MTAPVSDPLAPISNDQWKQLMALVDKYGTVGAIPPNELAAIGVSPMQAGIAMGQTKRMVPPTPSVNPGPIGDNGPFGIGIPLDSIMPPKPQTPQTQEGGFGGGGSFDTRPFPAQVPGNTGKPGNDTIFGAVVNGQHIPPPKQGHFLGDIFGKIASIPGYAQASAAQAYDKPPNLGDYLNGLGDSSQFSGARSGAVGYNSIPQPPRFQINDFSDQANSMAAKAYSPQFAALDAAKQQVNQNYDTASKIVDGLYDQATANITANTNATNQSYQKAQAANTTGGQQLRDTIGNTYQQSQQQVTDLLKQLGAGPQAGAAILPQGAQEQARQQSEAAQNTQAQGDFLTNEQKGMQNYQTGINQATVQEGNVQQQNLIGSRDNALNAYSQQGMDLASQQSLQALGLADQLSQQDLGLQQLNYGAGQDYYNNVMKEQQVSTAAQQQALQNALAMYGIDYQQYRDKIGDNQNAAQLGLTKYNIDTGNAIAQQNADTNSMQATAQIQAQSLKDAAVQESNDPNSQWTGQVLLISGGNPQLAGAIKQLVLAQAYTGQLPRDGQDFSKMVRAAATNAGINPDLADAAASAYYYSVMGSQYPHGGPNGSSKG